MIEQSINKSIPGSIESKRPKKGSEKREEEEVNK